MRLSIETYRKNGEDRNQTTGKFGWFNALLWCSTTKLIRVTTKPFQIETASNVSSGML
jgi:hypothetical protein